MKKDEIVRADVLRAAEKLFQRWGIRKTTMEDIAREAGKGKSTLYYYFESKEEVLEAVASTEIARITAAAEAAIEKKALAKEKLMAYAYTTLREVRKAIALYEIARGEIKADQSLIDGVMKKYADLDQGIVESILRFGIERGEFKSVGVDDIKAAVRAIRTVMRSLVMDLLFDNEDRQLIDLIIGLMSDGLQS